MEQDISNEHNWSDVFFDEEPHPTLSYRSGMVVYEESLIKGGFVSRAWNGSGYVNAWEDVRLDPAQHSAPQSFWLEIDGQLLASHWEWVDFEKNEETRLGSHGECTCLHAVVTLRHTIRPVTVKVHMLLDSTSVMTRWLEITNTGDQHAALSAVYPWSGVLKFSGQWGSHGVPVATEMSDLYSIGYMANSAWGDEGNFKWHSIPTAGYRVDGRYRRDRHRHPMFVLRNNATGEHFICQLAWSGGFSFEFDLDAPVGNVGAYSLFFRAGPDAPPPHRVIDPGETVTSPEVHLGMVFGDLDASIQAMHDHLRRSVFMPQPRGRGGWIESGIGPELEITTDYVFHQIENAAAWGSEVFFIDASWYAPPYGNWATTVGDWQVDRGRFPDGIGPFRDRCHEHGMLFGLWMDAERIGDESQIAQEHPEWLATAYDGEKRLGRMLDLSNRDAAEWMEDQITRVISENELEFFRLDYNVGGIRQGGQTVRNGYAESLYWRYYETLYAMYDRLRARFPDVILESCAGGGGRTDIGMVRRFSHSWVTDWQIAPRSFSITNGMTMALPPEHVDRLVAGQNGHIVAELDFQWRLLLFVRPTLAFFHPLGASWNPNQLARIRHFINLYKHFVRPFMNTGRIFHHTPAFEGTEPTGWGVLELASRDRRKAVAGIFQLSAPQESEYCLRFRGLDVSKRYLVTWDNSGQTCEVDGFTLMKQGLTIRLEGALTSELLRCNATE